MQHNGGKWPAQPPGGRTDAGPPLLRHHLAGCRGQALANVLNTLHGPLFIDFENTAVGPVEYDIAWVPRQVAERYPDADQALLDECRGTVLAIIATHRWSRGDQHPSGRRSGFAFLDAVRDGPPWPALDDVVW